MAAHATKLITTLVLGASPALAGPAVNCFEATDAINQRRWRTAEKLLRSRLALPDCAAQEAALRFQLAYALDQRSEFEPEHSCRAKAEYAEVAKSSKDPTIVAAAVKGLERTSGRCAALAMITPPPQPAPGTASEVRVEPAPRRNRVPAYVLLGLGGAAVLGGGALLYAAVQADGEREDAEAVITGLQTRLESGERLGSADEATYESARADFQDASDRATAFGIAGWSVAAAGVGLAALGALFLARSDEPTAYVGPGQAGLVLQF